MLQSYIYHTSHKQKAQHHEPIQILLSDSQTSQSFTFSDYSNPLLVEALQAKFSSLKKEITNIELQNALLDKRRGFKHVVAFLLGI